MARVVWDRRDDIKNAIELIDYKEKPSKENFKPPSRIESDFTRLLKHNVKHINWTLELIHDWYEVSTQTEESLAELTPEQLAKMYAGGCRIIRIHDDETGEETYYAVAEDGSYELTEEYKPIYIRGQMTPIDWKSKIGNSDMSTNFKTDYKTPIEKGDYVIREDGMLYMLNWNITNHANNQATQAVECNAIVDFTREVQQDVDPYGFRKSAETKPREIIAAGLPISESEYAGRPDYSGSSGQAGMHPDHLISVYCQWNTTTRKIRLDDEFVLGDFTYKVINISLAEVMVDRDYGVLTLNAKRVAGGTVSGIES